jgi:hypothetical protein
MSLVSRLDDVQREAGNDISDFAYTVFFEHAHVYRAFDDYGDYRRSGALRVE